MAFLDYLLGGVSGGFEGYERKKARELQAQKDEEERQVRLASLFSQGFEPVADVQRKQQAAIGAVESMARSGLSGVFGGPISSAPTTAGLEDLGKGYATARPDRTIDYGGQQLALRETAAERQDRQEKAQYMQSRRDAESAAEAARKAKDTEQAKRDERVSKMIEAARKGGRNSQAAIFLAAEDKDAFNALFPEPKSDGLSALQQMARKSGMDEAEAWFNTPEPDPVKRRLISATFNNLRNAPANRNRPAREIIKATFDAIKAREASEYKQAQTGKLESSGSDQLVGLLAPATATNPALEEERRAYDESVAKYGMDLVRSRFGPRP